MFELEKRNIQATAIVFNTAYLVRGILNQTVLPKVYNDKQNDSYSNFTRYMWTIVPGIFVDCLPLAAVMWLHH